MKPKYRIEVFRQYTMKATGQVWRWHLISLVGRKPIVCTSGEAFNRSNALRAARRMQKLLAVPTDFTAEAAS